MIQWLVSIRTEGDLADQMVWIVYIVTLYIKKTTIVYELKLFSTAVNAVYDFCCIISTFNIFYIINN